MAQAGLLNSIWQIVLQIMPFLLLLLLHHFLLAPLFFRKKLIAYIPVTLALLTAFGFYSFNVGNPPDMGRQPGQFQGPPPMMQEGSVPPPMPMDGMNPPPEGTYVDSNYFVRFPKRTSFLNFFYWFEDA